MTVGYFLVDLISKVCTLPSIVFTDAFFVVVGVLFTVGFFVKLITKVVLGVG